MLGKTIRWGAVAGMGGGVVMAMFSMVAMWLDGSGFWLPLNLIAHTAWSGAPLDATFSGAAIAIGLLIHMAISMMVGVSIALSFTRAPIFHRTATIALISGMMIGLVVWVAAQYVLWPLASEVAAKAFTPWIFAVAHAMFGIVTASLIRPRLGSASAEK